MHVNRTNIYGYATFFLPLCGNTCHQAIYWKFSCIFGLKVERHFSAQALLCLNS